MSDSLVQFEVDVQSPDEILSRIIWPDSEGPWIMGGLDDMMVHFAYASWTAFNLECGLAMSIVCKSESLGKSISDMMTRAVSSIGAVQVAEIHLTPQALESLRKERIEP